MVYRVYVERKEGFDYEAKGVLNDIRSFLGIRSLTGVRLINRYDAEDIDETLFVHAQTTVFSEPQTDNILSPEEIPADAENQTVFAVEYLPGQFDQRADSAAQCIQLISQGERPEVKTARVYVLQGALTEEEIDRIKQYLINPVESREASLALPATLKVSYETPETVEDIAGFRAFDEEELQEMLRNFGLAMDLDDLAFCQQYFREEERDPTITEIRMIDTYWSDHCRHTTFTTTLDHITFEDEEVEKTYEAYLRTREELHREKPVTLMDIGTIAARCLRAEGKLSKLDESEEINACTVKIEIEVDGKKEPWLLLFKNETHNHPTEIEPFGGAATCIGGAIRDPLSGRSYVYAAMRLTGAADPLTPIEKTMEGKLPQKKLVATAAAGYASYGNQIGLATGIVDELYHPGYAAKHMEVGAVIAAAPAENVRRERPQDGDLVILLGGRTGRDGCGGATGSSKSHTVESLESCGAEVQKGNAPEERKLQRLFRDPKASRMIKRCNDFGAGGVSVAVGELADGLDIDLDAVPKKYEGLDGTELAISESQERMAVVVEEKDAQAFIELAAKENLEATVIATVTESPRLVMHWKGNTIVDISRAFLNTNGAEKHAEVLIEKGLPYEKETPSDFASGMKALAEDIRTCSRRGLSERFDSTIGSGTVLMPFGGRYQRTPIQAMVHKISLEKGHTDDVSFMSWGFNPEITDINPYHGAYLAVVESVSKLIAAGASMEDVYLSFQEYFGKLRDEDKRWGKPAAALLGAYRAQMELGVAAIGGKDSMSGSFEDLDVPNTLISFAVTTGKEQEVTSGEWKEAGHKVVLLQPERGEDGLPEAESLLALYDRVHELLSSGKAVSAYTPGFGGIAEALLKMSLGNRIGIALTDTLSEKELFGYAYGSFILEMKGDDLPAGSVLLGTTTETYELSYKGSVLPVEELENAYEAKLESIYPCNLETEKKEIESFSFETKETHAPAVKVAKPRVLIPVFPGTNCEYASARAVEEAGAEAEIFIIRNLTSDDIAKSAEDFTKSLAQSQMLFIPGGFSGGDEPDGSGKFITAFLRGEAVKEGVMNLLNEREGLVLGICNGFQALVKLGLLPYGRIMDMNEDCPTLTFNQIGRHQSKIVRVRIASNLSPWLKKVQVGDIVSAPISHGEGRFVASEELIRELAAKGQIATQYVDLEGKATYDIQYNPNHSAYAIEGITSPDGRVLGKMGHAERVGKGLYKNVPGNYDIRMFEAAVEYFR
ncbi:MAG: phosphoribosylformylglycinamidine synthase [Lachnospiraceae bacterium]|nr:phosphoribosylformylglycinamidine synthase [Lachnospiraceae bacterium]